MSAAFDAAGDVIVTVLATKDSSSYCTLVTGLEESARYEISVKAINSVGESEEAVKIFRTKGQGKCYIYKFCHKQLYVIVVILILQ